MGGDCGKSEASFLYDAFISYRHVDRDRKWAEWLIAALERYRVPKALQDKGLPPRLRKVFRDEDEVPASADLNDQIREALIASRFLIVICSAFTPRSKWVEREIQIFNELGRSDQVLALLTEGEPGDSFPDAMLVRYREIIEPNGTKRTVKEDKEPLAADVRPRSGVSNERLKRLALLRLMAVILGVKFDDLRQREHERERKQHLTWAAIAAALALTIGGAAGFYWNLTRPTTAFYRQLVWRWGLPVGTGGIDAETHSHLGRSYSVVTRRGKVVEVTQDGWIKADASGFHRWVVHYDDDGNAEWIDEFDAKNRLARKEVFKRGSSANELIVTFERGNVPFTQAAAQDLAVNPNNTVLAHPVQAKADITRHDETLDGNGFATEVRYQDNWGTPQHDAQGSFGEHVDYAPDGLVLRRAEIGPAGEEITLRNGIRAVTFSYDRDSKLIRQSLLGEDGKPINGPEYWAFFQREEFDRWGNDTKVAFYDAAGKPAMMKDGYAWFTAAFDEQGNRIKVSFFDVAGAPTLTKGGTAATERKYDDRHNIVEESYFGVDGRPILIASGIAGMRETFDTSDDLTRVEYFGVDSKPTLNKENIAGFSATYDRHGDQVELTFFGIDRKPTPASSGVAVDRMQYDDRHELIKQQFLGIDKRPVASKQGIAGFGSTYDARGNRTSESHFGLDGKLTLGTTGAARIVWTYDDRGNNIGIEDFDPDNKPMLTASGFARIERRFDQRGNLIDISYFGIDGKPSLYSEGYARVRHSYDERGNTIETDFFGIDNKPTLDIGGVAVVKSAYNARSQRIMVARFGLDGKPANEKFNGYAKELYSYDNRGDVTEEAFFTADGAPGRSDGIATIKYTYDNFGRPTGTRYFDAAGRELHMELIVAQLVPGGQAATLGIAVGDRIVSYNGLEIASLQQMVDAEAGVGFRVLTVKRGAQALSFTVVSGQIGTVLRLVHADNEQAAQIAQPAPPVSGAPSR